MMNNSMTTKSPIEAVLIEDIRKIIRTGQSVAYSAVNSAMIETYWNIGKRIIEEEQNGSARAEYGKHLISVLSKILIEEFGGAYSPRNLHYYRKFYRYFPNKEILNARVHNLNWTHFRILLSVDDEDARIWYMNEAYQNGWSTRTLDRNISTQYYYRLLQSPKKDTVIAEMQSKTNEYQKKQFELLKNPIVAEFLEFRISSSDAYKSGCIQAGLLCIE